MLLSPTCYRNANQLQHGGLPLISRNCTACSPNLERLSTETITNDNRQCIMKRWKARGRTIRSPIASVVVVIGRYMFISKSQLQHGDDNNSVYYCVLLVHSGRRRLFIERKEGGRNCHYCEHNYSPFLFILWGFRDPRETSLHKPPTVLNLM